MSIMDWETSRYPQPLRENELHSDGRSMLEVLGGAVPTGSEFVILGPENGGEL